MKWMKARWAMFCLAFLTACHAQMPAPQRTWDQNAEIAINATAHAVEAADSALGAAFEHDAQSATTPDQEAALAARWEPAVEALLLARDALIDADRAVRDAVAINDAAAECRARVALLRAADDAQALIAQAQSLGAQMPVGMQAAVLMLGEVAAVLLPQCPVDAGAAG
jgi:hypothetical protein